MDEFIATLILSMKYFKVRFPVNGLKTNKLRHCIKSPAVFHKKC